jgi:ArsR family transcriptional regulator, arsenate/arsenite/antimonite-responsive transcriptional repressor
MAVKPFEATCCAPITDGVLDEDAAVELADALKVIADPARLRLLSLIAAAPEGEACACDLVEPLERTQPTVSHHLSMLVDAGFLTRERRGKWAYYRIDAERLRAVCAVVCP